MNDLRALRDCFGAFLTGVTVVTTIAPDGTPRGFSANSFTSVSLDPPLLLFCIAKSAASFATFAESGGFAVNILSESQQETARVFATKRPDKFTTVAWRKGPAGHPLIDGSIAWFDCTRTSMVDAGDHTVIFGKIEGYSSYAANPLGYARGGFVTLGMEREALEPPPGERLVVGAIVENEGKILLRRDGTTGAYLLPEVGRCGAQGSSIGLRRSLAARGIDLKLSFVFAVFSLAGESTQFIYYRGFAEFPQSRRSDLFAPEDIPWDEIADASTRTMLQQFIAESALGAFGVFSGHDGEGEVKSLVGA